MNIAVIFAGGTGQRMNSKTCPKQFLELHGKPILAYTIEKFQKHPEIDKIVLVSLKEWIDYCVDMSECYRFSKLAKIIPGGSTGQQSIKFGLECAKEISGGEETLVLLHDGVRPMIDFETISSVIECTQKNGSAVTVAPLTETLVTKGEQKKVCNVLPREQCLLARAPQCFKLHEILDNHKRAVEKNLNFVDSASMMKYFGYDLYYVEGPVENIKITTPMDFYLFRAIVEAKENSQIMGLSV